MKTRLISLMLSVVLLVCMVPVQAFAYIGALRESAAGVGGGVYEDLSSRKMAYIQNDYISFHICVEADSSLQEGTVCYTLPTAEITSMDDLSIYGMQQIAFRVDNREKRTSTGYQTVSGTPFFLLVNNVKYSVDKTAGTITVDYTFTDTDFTAKSVFRLVRLDRGLTYDITTANIAFPVRNNDSDTTQNWGVMCETQVFCSTTDYISDVTMLMSYSDFPKTGHSGADGSARVYANTVSEFDKTGYAYWSEEKGRPSGYTCLDITSGMGETLTDDIDEIFVDSYTWANPFVATGDIYMFDAEYADLVNDRGVEGHVGDAYYCGAVSYKSSILTTADTQYTFKSQESEGSALIPGRYSNLWGYRDLQTVETVPEVTERDNVVIPEDSQYLAVVKSGSGYSVQHAATKAELDALSNVVAALRGQYTYDKINKRYMFNKNVELSPSITAAWTTGTGVYLDEDGTLHIDEKNVSLNTPSFKFYKPKNGGYLKLSYSDDERGGLCIELDHGKNDAVISVNIPNVICKLSKAYLDLKGNLTFEGEFGIESLFDGATFTMDKLSYGLKSGDMKVNGIHAKGKIELTEGKLFGLGAGGVEGEVNTFKGEELYDFSLELEVGDLFSAKAKLMLVRLDNGRLCPEEIYFNVKNQVKGTGIDITPGTPVITLTGGGGGVTGLASTVNGNYRAIPPVVVRLEASAELAKVVEGDYTLEAGPSKLRISAEDLNIKVGSKKVQVISEMSAGFFAEEKDMTYNDIVYTGFNFGGDASLGLKVFNIPESDEFMYNTLGWFNGTIEAGFDVGANGFIGDNTEHGTYLTYVGIFGKAGAKLQIPERIPVIGGKKLLGADLDFKLGGASVVDASKANVKEVFSNMNVTGGLVATASVVGISGRVIYLIPDTVKVQGKLFSDFDEWDWDDTELFSTNKTMLLTAPLIASLDNGDEAIVLSTFKVAPVPLFAAAVPGAPDTVEKHVTADISALEDGEHLVFAIVPFGQIGDSIDGFADSLLIEPVKTDNTTGPAIELKYMKETTETVEGGSETGTFADSDENEDANAWIGTFETEENKDHEIISLTKAVYVSVPKSDLAGIRSFNIYADRDFAAKAVATVPGTTLFADVLSGGGDTYTLSAKPVNPETDAKYRLYVYYSTKPGSADYLVNVIDGGSTPEPGLALAGSGITAPTGRYYLSAFLTEETTITNEAGETEVFEIPVDSYTTENADIRYTYDSGVPEPSSVSLTASGNETMTASWIGSASNDADGYIVTIYQKDSTGNFVDTGCGYQQAKGDFTEDGAMRFDSETNTYSIDMAITVGGSGGSMKGDPKVKSSAALDADKTYKVGVTAYKNTEHAGVQCPSYSSEAKSAEQYLPKYEPLKLSFLLGGDPIERSDDGVFSGIVSGENNSILEISSDKDPDVTYTVNGAVQEDRFYTLPEFEGMVTLEIKASHTHNGVTDDTYEYVVVSKDNTAPVLTLDQDSFIADESGNFTITGICGACNKVSCEYTTVNLDAVADEDGAFAISGNIADSDGIVVFLQACDAAGNASSRVIAIVSPQPETIEIPGTPEDPTEPTKPIRPVKPAHEEDPDTETVTEVQNPFVDVKEGDFFYNAVLWAIGKNITVGVDETNFAPFAQASRGQMVTFLWKAAGKPEPVTTECPFTDISPDAYYYKAVLWACENGITAGKAADSFAPDDSVTRGQAVTFLWKVNSSVIADMQEEGSASVPFTDISPDAYYYRAILWAYGNGITAGTSPTTFSPDELCTRGQIVTFLYNGDKK